MFAIIKVFLNLFVLQVGNQALFFVFTSHSNSLLSGYFCVTGMSGRFVEL